MNFSFCIILTNTHTHTHTHTHKSGVKVIKGWISAIVYAWTTHTHTHTQRWFCDIIWAHWKSHTNMHKPTHLQPSLSSISARQYLCKVAFKLEDKRVRDAAGKVLKVTLHCTPLLLLCMSSEACVRAFAACRIVIHSPLDTSDICTNCLFVCVWIHVYIRCESAPCFTVIRRY